MLKLLGDLGVPAAVQQVRDQVLLSAGDENSEQIYEWILLFKILKALIGIFYTVLTYFSVSFNTIWIKYIV